MSDSSATSRRCVASPAKVAITGKTTACKKGGGATEKLTQLSNIEDKLEEQY